MKHLFVAVICILGLALPSQAQSPVFTTRNYSENNLISANFNTVFNANTLAGRSYAYYRFKSIPTELDWKIAQEQGVKFLDYIPENIYLLSVPATASGLSFIISNPLIVSQVSFENEKYSDNLLKRYAPASNKSSLWIDLYVYAYDDLDIIELSKSLADQGRIISNSDVFHRISMSVPCKNLVTIAANPGVKIIDMAPFTPVSYNLPGKTNHRSTLIGSSFGRNLQGDSIVLGEWDGEGAGTHVDIDTPRVTRMSPYVNNSNGAHATHVCGTMAGAGVINPFATGMAPRAKVYSWNFYGDITGQMDSGVRFQNVMITQNSYGYGDADDTCAYRGRYDDISHELDILVRNHPNLVHVFAAGNSQSLCGLGGYRTVFSGFQSAKNIISVGALTDQDAMSSFSSWGPVRDGRIKPEVCAVGVNVYSTLNLNTYAGGWNGTSMACPGTSGTVAQLVQRYRQLNAGKNPEASLMRVILANSADDVFNAGPDFKSGFGRINALTAVKAIEQNRYKVDSITNGNYKVDSFFVGTGLQQIKVALAWSDKEAAIIASKALVNNLDLYIITPVNDTIRPWVLDTQFRTSPAIHGIDSINNIEQITIDAPGQGYYKIYVKGTSVPFGPQIYAYTYERVAKAVTVIFPNGGEQLSPSKSYTIKWDAVGVGSTCNIEFTLNNGATWSTMVSGISVALKNYNWGVPNVNTSQARIRITAGAYSDLSDSTFNILTTIDTIKGVTCDKQVTLKWKQITGVTGYDVMQLKNGFMQSVAIVTDTFYTIQGLTNGVKYWFTIRGKYNNVFGERAYGVSFTPGSAPIPPQISLQPFTPAVCSGALISLKAKATGTATIQQQWQVSIDSGKTFVNVPFATDTVFGFISNTTINFYKIRSFFYNSCQNFQYSDTVTIIVDTTLAYALQPQNTSVCIGADAVFSANAPSFSTTTYQWQYNDGVNGWLSISGANAASLTLTNVPFSKNGWLYRVVASNKCTSNLISNIATLKVKAPLQVSALGGTTLCYGQATSLSANATGGDSTKYVFEWSLNGTVIQRSHSSLLNVSPLITQTYTVMLWDSCSTLAVADSDSVTVNVLSPLGVVSNAGITICKGNSTSMLAIGFGGNSNYTFGWLQGNTTLQYSSNNTLTVSPSTTTTYRVFVTDSCSPRKDTATITVYVRQALKVTQQCNPDTVCIGAQTQITATAIGGDSTYNYTFIDANTNFVLQNGLNNKLTTNVNPSNNYILVLSDNCTNLNDTLRFKIPVRNKLSLSVTKNPTNDVCSNNPVTLTATPLGGALKNYTFQWRRAGSTTILGTNASLNVADIISTRYVVTLRDGCTAASASDSIMVNIEKPDPVFSITYSNGQDFAYFTAARSGYKSYFWKFGDGDTTSEFQPNHRYKLRGNYNVCLKITTFNNCDSEYCDTVKVSFNNGINQNDANGFTYSPNPFHESLQLQFDDLMPSEMKLFDALGREISIELNPSQNMLVNTSSIIPGNYILKLVFQDQVQYLKLIKQ